MSFGRLIVRSIIDSVTRQTDKHEYNFMNSIEEKLTPIKVQLFFFFWFSIRYLFTFLRYVREANFDDSCLKIEFFIYFDFFLKIIYLLSQLTFFFLETFEFNKKKKK